MKIKVTKDNLKIAEKDLVHKGEYNVNTLEFEFSDDYTGISKMAVFSTPLNVTTYEVPITNNTCIIPHEVLTQRGTLTIGVYGYTVEDEVINKRYSPNPVTIPIDNGSYISGASNAQEQEPTLFEEFVEQIEQDFDNVSDDINVLAQSITDLDNAKQDKLTAGTNITIENNVISSTAEVNAIDKIKVNNVEQPIVNKTVNISVPTKTSDISNDSGFITKEVDDLTNYELKTNTGSTIALSINPTTYVMTLALKNSAGTTISSGTVDLPIESLILDIDYDEATKELIITYQSGQTIRVGISQLISGLVPDNRTIAGIDLTDNITKSELQTAIDFDTKQNVIDSSHKLLADNVDDTNQTNKFVTEAEKSTWNNKSDFTGNYEDLNNKPDLTQYEEKSNKTNELSGNSTQTQYPNAEIVYKWLDSITPSNEVSGETIHVEDSSNLPIKDFAMLGNATQADTPTPDTPQDIHVVTGDNTVKVVGKNLLDSSQVLAYGIAPNQGEIQPLSGRKAFLIEVEPNNTYTFSRASVGTASYSYWAILEDFTPNQINDYISHFNFTSELTTIINTTANTKYIMLFFGTGLSTDMQLERNSIATTYEPYAEQTQLISLGSIELARIPNTDIKDRIFKAVQGNSIYDSLDSTTKATLTVGSWYKQGNIGKVTFNGTESWKYDSGTHARFYLTYNDLAYQLPNNTSALPITICNKLLSTNTQYIYDHTYDNAISGHNINHQFWIYMSQYKDLTSFQQWLSTATPNVFYIKVTPTYTEITDTTLISQLENVLKMHTNKNVTNAWIEPTGTNAQAGMVLVYRQDLQTLITNNTNAILSL